MPISHGANQNSKPTVDIVALANAAVFNSEGQKIKIGHLWNKGTAILVFLRHFACIACRAHAAEVWADREKYEKCGARIVFIGNGGLEFVEAFKEDLGLKSALVLTDPSLDTFRAAGLKHGYFAVLGPRAAFNMHALASRGHTGSLLSARGSRWQLGGVVAVNPKGKVVYQFVSESLGDLPTEENVETMMSEVAADPGSASGDPASEAV